LALRARNLEFSPGWAVGWWFVPFANLVKPFQVMRELYNESDPDFEEEPGFLSVKSGAPELMGFWWGFFLISNFTYTISNAIFKAAGETASPGFLGTFIVASVLHVAGAVCAIILIKKITERQEQRFARLATAQTFAPPPPPDFSGGN
jgi:Na+/proline symporter